MIATRFLIKLNVLDYLCTPLFQHYPIYSRVHCTLMSGYASRLAVPKLLPRVPRPVARGSVDTFL